MIRSTRTRCLTLLLLALPATAIAHGGRLDEQGCHYGGTASGYHCHAGPLRQRPQPHASARTSTARLTTRLDAGISANRTVVRVMNADTIVLTGGEKVRLIGVDTWATPHRSKRLDHLGNEPSTFARRLLDGQRVRLMFDQQQRDRYGRTLAYVYLPDGRLANEEIIRHGYAYASTKYPFVQSMMDRFRAAQQEARTAGKGLWARK